MTKWINLLTIYFITAGCTSYKKAVNTHAMIDDKLERNQLIFEHNESNVDTSIWQNKKIVITDVEFYPSKDYGAIVGDPNLLVPSNTVQLVNPIKRIRHMIVESIEEQQAINSTASSVGSIEVNKVQINEQEDIKEEKIPVAGGGLVYIFVICVVAIMLVLVKIVL